MNNLEPKHYKALCILASGGTIENAAKTSGVSIPAIKKWKSDPTFKKALRDCSAKLYDATITKLVIESEMAAKTLVDIIQDTDVTARTKVGAITLLLNIAAKSREFILESRLEKVEALLADTEDFEE